MRACYCPLYSTFYFRKCARDTLNDRMVVQKTQVNTTMHLIATEAEFLDVIGTKVLSVFVLDNHSHFITVYTPPPPTPPEQKWFETCLSFKHGIRNLKSENSQDYAQKPQRNCTFMNSAVYR